MDKPVPFSGFPLSPMKVPSCSNAVGSFVLVTFMPKKDNVSSRKLTFDSIFQMFSFDQSKVDLSYLEASELINQSYSGK